MRLILSVASFLLISLMLFNGYQATADQGQDFSGLEFDRLPVSADLIRVAEEQTVLPEK